MAKSFLEELIDELNELHLTEVQRLHDAVENREKLPLILNPAVVMKTVNRVAWNHHITTDELITLLGTQNLSADEMTQMSETLNQLSEEEKNA